MDKQNNSLLSVATNLKPLTPLIISALSGGEITLVQSILIESGFFCFNQAQKILEDEGKSPDFEKNGHELPLKLAQMGSGKQDYVRKLWINAVKNSLDSDYPHWIRNEDIKLLESLNSADLVIIYLVGNHGDKMHEDFNFSVIPTYLEPLKDKSPKVSHLINKGFHIDYLYDYFNLSFGQKLNIPKEELWYALNETSIINDTPNGNEIFKDFFSIRGELFFEGRSSNTISSPHPCFNEVLCISLTEKAKRILRIITNVNNIF